MTSRDTEIERLQQRMRDFAATRRKAGEGDDKAVAAVVDVWADRLDSLRSQVGEASASTIHERPASEPSLDVERLAQAIDAAWRKRGSDHHVFGPGLADEGRILARLIAAEWPDA